VSNEYFIREKKFIKRKGLCAHGDKTPFGLYIQEVDSQEAELTSKRCNKGKKYFTISHVAYCVLSVA